MNTSRILVVEDDRFIRELYTDLLKEAGYGVEIARDGKEAYEKIKAGSWDLILLDIILPDISGLEIAQSNPNSKIVFMTNIDREEDLEKIKKLGRSFFIKSEITPDQFIRKIESYL